MVTNAGLQILSRATLDLYSPDLAVGNFTEHGFRFLSALVPCDLINFGDLQATLGTLEATSNHQPTGWEQAVEAFGRCMWNYPLFRFDPTVNGGRPFFRNDFYTRRQFQDLDMYSECFRILGANNHAAVHVASEDGHTRFFALERGGNVNYTERDRVLLDLAQQHLANALLLAKSRQRPVVADDPRSFSNKGLTVRESEVAYWLTQGKTNVEISILMRLRLQTVKAHLTSMFNKTGASNRLALTLHLMENGRGRHPDETWHRVDLSGDAAAR